MFSALCRFFMSGDLLVAQKSYFLQKSVQKTWDTVNGRFWAKKPKIVILDQHICSYRWHIWTIGSVGVDMMFWGTFSPNIVARNLKKKNPLAFIEWCFLGPFLGTFGPLYPKRQHFWLTRVNQNMFFTYPMIRATFYLFTFFWYPLWIRSYPSLSKNPPLRSLHEI